MNKILVLLFSLLISPVSFSQIPGRNIDDSYGFLTSGIMIFLILERNSNFTHRFFEPGQKSQAGSTKTEKLLFHRDMATPEDSKSLNSC